jgi:hypothetical protein
MEDLGKGEGVRVCITTNICYNTSLKSTEVIWMYQCDAKRGGDATIRRLPSAIFVELSYSLVPLPEGLQPLSVDTLHQ